MSRDTWRASFHRLRLDLFHKFGWGVHPLVSADRERTTGRQDRALGWERSWSADRPRSGVALVEARHQLGDSSAWLRSVNVFLAVWGQSPVTLAADGTIGLAHLRGTSIPRSVAGPRVSVIVPVHQAAETLEYSLRSLFAQTWADLEIWAVDDASTDDSPRILRELAAEDSRLHVLTNPHNVGPYVSKNRAVSRLTGVYLTGHDADDWAHPERIERQVEALRRQGALAGMAKSVRVDARGRWELLEHLSPDRDPFVRECFISAIFETAFFRRHLGAWDSVRFAADSELVARAQRLAGTGWMGQEVIAEFMLLHAASLTGRPDIGIAQRGGMSPVRREYRAAWKQWHAVATAPELCLPFPPQERAFPAPPSMVVSVGGIEP